jgi:hypothetical protein
MNCPSDIAAVVLEILRMGTIRIRAFAGANDAKRCFIEADHLHNLPGIVSDYRPDRLRYYWELERPSFIRQVPDRELRDLQPLWDRLGELIDQYEVPPLTVHSPEDHSVFAK